jgi:hypothetical protein
LTRSALTRCCPEMDPSHGCEQPIDADAPDTIRAVELVPVPTMGKPNQVAEGMPALFHDVCFPGAPRYKRV